MEILVDLLFDVLAEVLGALVSSPAKPVSLLDLARELGGTVLVDEIHIRRDGATLRIAYTRRQESPWTEIEVDVPPSYPFTLRVRRHERSLRAIAPLRSGDDRFDREFLIDGAPADVVSRFFDEPLRRVLQRQRKPRLATHHDDERAFVRLSIPGRQLDGTILRFLVESMARIPLRLRAAYAEADRAIAVEHDGGPYRDEPSARPERDIRAVRAYEVERVIAMRARRG